MSIKKIYYRQTEVSKIIGVSNNKILEWKLKFNLKTATTRKKASLFSKTDIEFFKTVYNLSIYFSVDAIKLIANGGLNVELHGKKIEIPKATMWR